MMTAAASTAAAAIVSSRYSPSRRAPKSALALVPCCLVFVASAASARAFSLTSVGGAGAAARAIIFDSSVSSRVSSFRNYGAGGENSPISSSAIVNTRGGALGFKPKFGAKSILTRHFSSASTLEVEESAMDLVKSAAAKIPAGEKLAAMRAKMEENGVDGEIFLRPMIFCMKLSYKHLFLALF